MLRDPLHLKIPSSAPRGGSSVMAWIGRQGLKVLGWRIHGEFANKKKLIVVVAPHKSNWDWILGVCVLWALRLKFSYFIKGSVMVWPLSVLIRRTGGIPVDRASPDGVLESITEAFRQQEKLYFAITPEGTRKEVSRWKSGFLRIAHKAQVPVVPAFIDYRKKELHVFEPFELSGEVEQDLKLVQDFYLQQASNSD